MRENGLNLEVSMATVALTKKIQQNKKLWTERTLFLTHLLDVSIWNPVFSKLLVDEDQ